MKITVFFRSKEKSNGISSATKHQLLASKVDKFINVDFINLDKRNLKKYLEFEPRPDAVYLWYEEENAIDYIKEIYPSITIHTFDNKERVTKKGYWGYDVKYVLGEKIIESFKDTTGFKEVYEVNIFEWTIKKQKMTNYDYENTRTKNKYFETKELAIKYLIENLKRNISDSEKTIERIKDTVSKQKKILKKFEKENISE